MEEHFPSESLRATDNRARNGAVAPRVTLDSIIEKIDHCVFFTGGEAARAFGGTMDIPAGLDCMTICLITTVNGFTVIGKSAPAAPENFDAAKGRELAHDDAIRQLWPLEGYLLREQLHTTALQGGPLPSDANGTIQSLVLIENGKTRTFKELT